MCYNRLDQTGGGRQCPNCSGEITSHAAYCATCGVTLVDTGALPVNAQALAETLVAAGAEMAPAESSFESPAYQSDEYLQSDYADSDYLEPGPEPTPEPESVPDLAAPEEEEEDMYVPPSPDLVDFGDEEPPGPPSASFSEEEPAASPPPPPGAVDLGDDEDEDLGWELDLPSEEQ
jgi:hypothetical protein